MASVFDYNSMHNISLENYVEKKIARSPLSRDLEIKKGNNEHNRTNKLEGKLVLSYHSFNKIINIRRLYSWVQISVYSFSSQRTRKTLQLSLTENIVYFLVCSGIPLFPSFNSIFYTIVSPSFLSFNQ